jgi:hypothetical protein
VGLAAIVIALLTLVPFPMSRTTGYQITLADLDEQSALSTDVLVSVLAAIGYEQVNVSVSRTVDQTVYAITNLPSETVAREIAAALSRVTTYGDGLTIEPVVEHITAPLYAQVAEKVKGEKKRPIQVQFEDGKLAIDGREFQSVVSSSEFSDAEVTTHIRSVLSDYGIGADEVTVNAETSADGYTRRLELRLINDTLVQTDAPALEITVREGNTYLRASRDQATLQGEDGFLLDVGKKKFAGKTIIVIIELKVDED